MTSRSASTTCARWLPVVVLVLASGCSLLAEEEAVTLYALPATDTSRQAASPSSASLAVATPEADRPLDSERIVVMPEPNVINVYGGARWHDTAPVLVRERLIEALQQSGLFTSVSSARLPGDLTLFSELRRFHSDYTQGAVRVVIELDTHLSDTGTNQRLASRQFSATATATDEQIPSIVAAFGEAGDELSRDVVQWLAREAPYSFNETSR